MATPGEYSKSELFHTYLQIGEEEKLFCTDTQITTKAQPFHVLKLFDDDDDEIAYFTVRWKTRASFVYRTKNMR